MFVSSRGGTRSPAARPPRRARAWVLAVLLLVLCACERTPAPARPEVRATPAWQGGLVGVATWNMCGVDAWGCAETGGRAGKRSALARLAQRPSVHVVLLQEVCRPDLSAALAALGSRWHSAWLPYHYAGENGRLTGVPCDREDGDARAGLAVLADRPLSRVAPVTTPRPTTGLRRGAVCATVAAYRLRVCDAHLTPLGSDHAHPHREYRAEELRALLGAAGGGRFVYGGDFNLNPPGRANAASGVWPRAAYRTHRECDEGRERPRPTHSSGHKLDYLFTASPRAGCGVFETGASDHRALVMTVRLP